MCTALTFNNGDSYFGRNMDIGYSFNEEIVIMPRNFPINYKKVDTQNNHFAMIGVACVIDNYPLFADAINEKGLAIAGLNFPRYAKYNQNIDDKMDNITPYEIIPWILATCETVADAKKLISKMNVVAIEFMEGLELATLHWIISDKKCSIVLEIAENGMNVHENQVGVLTNNPTFDWHMTNLSNYLNCDPIDLKTKNTLGYEVKPLGHGTGGLGLPGDTSTTSRFVKAVFAKASAKCEANENSNVSQFFHMLDAVAVTRGFAIDANGNADYTTYSVCANQNSGTYYYKTYDNNQISAVKLHNVDLDSKDLFEFKMILEQQINFVN